VAAHRHAIATIAIVRMTTLPARRYHLTTHAGRQWDGCPQTRNFSPSEWDAYECQARRRITQKNGGYVGIGDASAC
jgi:hypothetical protein